MLDHLIGRRIVATTIEWDELGEVGEVVVRRATVSFDDGTTLVIRARLSAAGGAALALGREPSEGLTEDEPGVCLRRRFCRRHDALAGPERECPGCAFEVERGTLAPRRTAL